MPPQQIKARVEYSRVLAAHYLLLSLVPEQKVGYRAGQYLSLLINEEGERRSYSLASWPSRPQLELVVDTSPMGKGSRYVLGLKPGEEVEILYPLGRFTLEDTVMQVKANKLFFVGTGSGIVPLRSLIHSALEEKRFLGEVHLHWGMRYRADLFWQDEFEELAQRYPNFRYDIVLSKPDEDWTGCRGHVNDCLVGHYEAMADTAVFLCGNQGMITEVAKLLEEKDLSGDRIYFEKFY